MGLFFIRVLPDEFLQEPAPLGGVPLDDGGVPGVDEEPFLFGGPGGERFGFLQSGFARRLIAELAGRFGQEAIGDGELGIDRDGFFRELPGLLIEEVIVGLRGL